MQLVDKNGNIFGSGIEITGPDGKPKTISGGGSPSGPAGGDLSGTYPNPGVTWANGLPIYDTYYYPLSSNPAGYLTAITSSDVTTALGYTPYNSTNPAGYITTAALSGYLTAATAASTYYPIPTGTASQYIKGDGTFAAFPSIPTVTPSALTKTDDTNVTLTLGGTPSTSLLQSVSLTLGWTGTLADSRIASASTWNAKQDALVSGTNIKTINGNSILGSGDLTVSAGLTVGTTAITSGTIGRVLFQGTGNVLQQSTNLFWDNTNNRLGIGTSSPSFSLDVNGTAKVQSGIAIGGGTIDAIRLFDLQVASSSDLLHRFWNSGTGGAKMRFVSNDGTNAQHQWTSASYWLAAISVNSSIGMDFRIGLNATEAALDASTRMRIFTNGNVGIGTTTDAGYKLDVNGTARVSSTINGRALLTNTSSSTDYAISLNGINTTDTTTRYLINLGALSATGAVFGAQGIVGSVSNYGVGTFITNNQNNSIGHVVSASSGTLAVPGFSVRTNGQATGGSIGYTWMVGNNQYFFHSVYNDGTYYNLKLYNRTGDIYYVRDRDTTNITFGASTYYASAQLAIDSTTKGFLPPRMTNAQMLAIATPAAGLVVYDTTNNKHCGYNGTAWQNFY